MSTSYYRAHPRRDEYHNTNNGQYYCGPNRHAKHYGGNKYHPYSQERSYDAHRRRRKCSGGGYHNQNSEYWHYPQNPNHRPYNNNSGRGYYRNRSRKPYYYEGGYQGGYRAPGWQKYGMEDDSTVDSFTRNEDGSGPELYAPGFKVEVCGECVLNQLPEKSKNGTFGEYLTEGDETRNGSSGEEESTGYAAASNLKPPKPQEIAIPKFL